MRSAKLSAGTLVVSLGIALIAGAPAIAEDLWPQRAVTLIVPFGSGAGPDIAARIYAEQLAILWKQPVVIENR
ncbi:MAG TPA: tripartite tricarboxylate transporter substrate binding protein, partial [Xanthobacteraceae bacterium]|nr:tripartite tricarboxylate transporter substrate binding protein [Xanthobacteraceae bacterium]